MAYWSESENEIHGGKDGRAINWMTFHRDEKIQDKFVENHDCRMSCRAGIPVEEPLTNKYDVKQTADSSVSKNKGVFWIKERTSICPSQDIGSSSKAAGFQSNEAEKDFCELLFDDTPAGLEIAFVDNDNDQAIDLLCYDWYDISNFEDVDNMFRNCDPTFGQWSNTDGPSWISSSSDIHCGPEDTLTSGFESSTLESKDMNDRSSYCANVRSLPESRTENIADHNQSHCTSHSWELTTNVEQLYNGGGGDETKPALTVFAYVNCLDKQPQNNFQVQQHNRQFSSHVQGKGIVPYPQLISKRNCSMESDSSSYIGTLNPTVHVEKQFLYKYLSLPTLSSTITDWNKSPSSFEVSDHVTNWASHGTDKLPDSLLKDPVVKLKEMVGKPSIRPVEMANSVTKQHDGTEQDMHSDGGSLNVGIYSTVQKPGKSSAIPSIFSDELSIKAVIFQQLHDIVDQLDVRKKLCIRDSLYRLARSAEQRHSHATPNQENIESRRGLHGTEALRKFVDYMETRTNPVDRSVAHLLFHSAPETITVSADIMSLESYMID